MDLRQTWYFFLVSAAVASGLFAPSHANAHEGACRDLHEAVFMDEPDVVMTLIQKGVDVNCLDQLRHTPIITATAGASLESFMILLRHGAKINVKDEWGMTLIRRIQDGIDKFSVNGGNTYRQIYQRMADMVEAQSPVN